MVGMDGKGVALEEVATPMQTHFLSQAPNQCEETSWPTNDKWPFKVRNPSLLEASVDNSPRASLLLLPLGSQLDLYPVKLLPQALVPLQPRSTPWKTLP